MTTGATPRRRDAKERLLAAADELFYTEGIHTVGIDRIIAKAGTAKGSLYYSYGSKADLVRDYLAGRHARWVEKVDLGIAGADDPAERILRVFDVLGELFRAPDYQGCAFSKAAAEAEAGSVEAEGVATFRTWLHELFSGLVADAGYTDVPAVTQQLVLLYDGANTSSHLDSAPAAAEAAKAMAASVLSNSARTSLKPPARRPPLNPMVAVQP